MAGLTPLCGPSGDPARRRDRVSNGFNLWKQRTDLSYRDVGSFDSFAQRAHVVTEYPASTLLIDDCLGLEIQFDCLDDDLDEFSFTEAQEDRLLVFAGDEILSVWGAQLIAAGRYRLWTIRARRLKSETRNPKFETSPKPK